MKKLLRTVLCLGLLAMLSIPAFAVQGEVPEKQGDFYVLANGAYMTFTDAAPKIKDNHLYLPLVATLDQLGFAEKDMIWDGITGTITATKGDTTLSLTLGTSQITLIEGGETTVIELDIAPYVEPGVFRTYISFDTVADVLGYNVGWDASSGTVIIDDVDAILAANTETYTLMDQYMEYGKTFYGKNQKVTGNYTMNIGMDTAAGGESAAFRLDVGGKYEMIMAGATAAQFETGMVLDISMAENGVDVTAEELGEYASLFPLDIDLDLRGNIDTGVFYFQSQALAELMGQPEMGSAWYKLDLASMFDQMGAALGMDYTSLMELSKSSLTMDFEEYLSTMLKAIPLTSVNDTTSDLLAELNGMFGDSAFQKSGSSYVSSLKMDGTAITFTLYTNGSKVNGYTMEMAMADPTFGEVNVSASMKNSKMEMSMGMGMLAYLDEDAYLSFSIAMDMDGTYQATSTEPATTPPAGAVIIDLNALMG